jgi:GH35 family endo-1,4-beta-xylanase
MRSLIRIVGWCWFGAVCVAPEACAQPINGSALALRSTGSGAGTWTLNRNGYVGTYIDVPATGNVTIQVNASGASSGGIDPHMNLVLADTKAGFTVTAGVNPYEHTFSNVPAGRYVVRAEFTNDIEASARSLAIQNLAVTGATVMNTSNSTNALAAADTYIDNFRRGTVKVALSGVAPGATVDVSLKRHAFAFGTAIHGFGSSGVGNYLDSTGTLQQTNFQSRLNQNFNALVPENVGKWSSSDGAGAMGGVDKILNYAQNPAHPMNVRMHNLIWGDNGNNGQQPGWVLNDSENGLLDLSYDDPGTTDDAQVATSRASLRTAISNRIDTYVGTGAAGDRGNKYYEIDVYNESYHTGADPFALPHNYWNAYGASGVADIYREVRDTIAAADGAAKVFVNDYSVLSGTDYGRYYTEHIEGIRSAGIAAGYGDVVQGIGGQYYPSSLSGHNPRRAMEAIQNFAVQGLPFSLTEFGVHNPVSDADAATILGEMMRIVFGNANSTGFFMWGFHSENGDSNLYPKSNELYRVNNVTSTNDPDWNTWTITDSGKMWRDTLGIEDFGVNPDEGWTTQLDDLVVAPDGTINFTGYWGDYVLTIDGQTYPLALAKGDTLYSVPVAPGDYNSDGIVDMADYIVWRKSYGSSIDLRADGNGDLMVDDGDYNVWRTYFGHQYSPGGGPSANVPEPRSLLAMLAGGFLAALRVTRPFRGQGRQRPRTLTWA